METVAALMGRPMGYLETEHAKMRMAQRGIDRQQIRHVLLHGWHEESRDRCDGKSGRWSYSIRGRTLCGRELRIVVALERAVIVVTAMELLR